MKSRPAIVDSFNFSSTSLEDLFADEDKYKIITVKGIGCFEPQLWRKVFNGNLKRHQVEVKILETNTGLSLGIKRFSASQDRQTLEIAGLHGYSSKSYFLRKLLKELWNKIQECRITRVDVAIDYKGAIPQRVLKALKKNRHPFQWKNTTYMKSKKEKKSNQRINILLYPKHKKENLDYEVERLEFSFRGDYFSKLHVKDLEGLFKKMQKTIKRLAGLDVQIKEI